jgi:hypothetical protein
LLRGSAALEIVGFMTGAMSFLNGRPFPLWRPIFLAMEETNKLVQQNKTVRWRFK